MFNWENCPEVEATPGKVSGVWCFKGTRLPLWCLFDEAMGTTVEEFCHNYPSVTPDKVNAVLDFMAVESRKPAHENPV